MFSAIDIGPDGWFYFTDEATGKKHGPYQSVGRARAARRRMYDRAVKGK